MRILRATLAIAVFVAGARAAAAQDKIVWKGERAATEGTVVSINFVQIKYRMSGAGSEQEDFAREVKDIKFDPTSTTLPYYEFDQGLKALARGQAREAATNFENAIKRILSSNSPNHPMRDWCRKHIIEAHLAGGDADAAVKAARELRKEKADSFFLRDSFLMQYDAAKLRRDSALLAETIRELEEVIKSDRKFQDLQHDADLLKADVAETARKYAEALAIYARLGGNKELWEPVSLGMLRCYSALNRTADLKTKVESLLTEIREKRESAPRVYLGAVIGRGDVNLAEGKIKEALLDYMKAAIDPGNAANSYEHETAYAKAAIAAAKLGKQYGEKDKANKTLYIDRARELREELKKTFPSTALLGDVDAAIQDAARGS